jgi:hypothetical protein
MFKVLKFKRCAVDLVKPCAGRVYGTMEVYVDDRPPTTVDWYSKLLMRVWEAGYGRTWVVLGFCQGHSSEMLKLAEEVLLEPDLWAPGRDNPPVFPHPLKVVGESS